MMDWILSTLIISGMLLGLLVSSLLALALPGEDHFFAGLVSFVCAVGFARGLWQFLAN